MRAFIEKLISYLVPIIRNYRSEFNGDLEVIQIRGHKVLNSRNANYSYGTLQKTLKFALSKVNTQNLQTVLLLGMGGGSVIRTLIDDFSFRGEITAVELDPLIIDIADKEFGIKPGNRIKIHNTDALRFVEQDEAYYQLIIIDLFIDHRVPQAFMKASFWEDIISLLSPNGTVIFNTMFERDNLQPIRDLLERHGLQVSEYHELPETNNLLIAKQTYIFE